MFQYFAINIKFLNLQNIYKNIWTLFTLIIKINILIYLLLMKIFAFKLGTFWVFSSKRGKWCQKKGFMSDPGRNVPAAGLEQGGDRRWSPWLEIVKKTDRQGTFIQGKAANPPGAGGEHDENLGLTSHRGEKIKNHK